MTDSLEQPNSQTLVDNISNSASDDTVQAIIEIIQTLPLEQRSIVYFHYCDGLETVQIAEKLAVSEEDVKEHLSLAQEKIREELSKRGDKEGLKLWMAAPLMIVPALKLAFQGTAVTASAATGVTTATATTTGVATGTTAATTATTTGVSTTTIIAASVAGVLITGGVITTAVILSDDEPDISRTPVITRDYSSRNMTDDELVELILSGSIPDDEPVVLDLSYNEISDISPLAEFTNITSLYLGDNQISDLTPLRDMRNLKTLLLFKNDISDLSPLRGLTNLTLLHLYENNLTDEQIDELQAVLRDCQIVRER